MNKGLGNFQQLNASILTGNYTYGSWSDNFFAFLSIIYLKNHDFVSTNSFISSTYSLSEKIRIKDRQMLLFNAQTDFFIAPVSSNLKLTSSYNKTNFKNVVNHSDLREVVNTSLNYGVELRSAFNGVFNYHIGTRWDTYSVRVFEASNRYTNNYSFLDLYFVLGSQIDFKVQGESYYFANLQKGHRQFHFVDLEGKYRIKENKISLSIICSNISGTTHFTNFTLSDIKTSRLEYTLQPRYFMLKTEFRFNLLPHLHLRIQRQVIRSHRLHRMHFLYFPTAVF